LAVSKAPLSVTHPALAHEWHPDKNGGLSPDAVTSDSQQSVWWRCPDHPDEEWQEVIATRARAGSRSACGR
jgi:hypothetical protein